VDRLVISSFCLRFTSFATTVDRALPRVFLTVLALRRFVRFASSPAHYHTFPSNRFRVCRLVFHHYHMVVGGKRIAMTAILCPSSTSSPTTLSAANDALVASLAAAGNHEVLAVPRVPRTCALLVLAGTTEALIGHNMITPGYPKLTISRWAYCPRNGRGSPNS
jgi:hypothetical protein